MIGVSVYPTPAPDCWVGAGGGGGIRTACADGRGELMLDEGAVEHPKVRQSRAPGIIQDESERHDFMEMRKIRRSGGPLQAGDLEESSELTQFRHLLFPAFNCGQRPWIPSGGLVLRTLGVETGYPREAWAHTVTRLDRGLVGPPRAPGIKARRLWKSRPTVSCAEKIGAATVCAGSFRRGQFP
jgi:hypothetical protein